MKIMLATAVLVLLISVAVSAHEGSALQSSDGHSAIAGQNVTKQIEVLEKQGITIQWYTAQEAMAKIEANAKTGEEDSWVWYPCGYCGCEVTGYPWNSHWAVCGAIWPLWNCLFHIPKCRFPAAIVTGPDAARPKIQSHFFKQSADLYIPRA